VEKTFVIHNWMLVYYYYQFVYKLVYYNNKTDNAHSPALMSKLDNSSPAKTGLHQFASPGKLNQFRSPNQLPNACKANFCRYSRSALWKSRGISTGSDVQNAAFFLPSEICPRFVQTSHKLCTAGKRARKSLMLWSKPELSTEALAFTIYYQFLYTP